MKPVVDWTAFLSSWSDEVIAMLREYERFGLTDREPEALRRGSLFYPPATDQQIQALEARLGVTLPPSYVSFLKASNGWLQIGMDAADGDLWSAEKVGWLRELHPDLVVAWTAGSEAADVPDDIYFVYGEEQDCVNMRSQYLKSALAVSDFIEAAVYLLNPEVKTQNCEWEAWFFGMKLPGANRYQSFAEMMLADKQRVLENLRFGLEYRAQQGRA